MRVFNKANISYSLVSLVFLATIIAVLVPFSPSMPQPGLESWVLALNQAVAQGLHFGTDVVFTFGPYASVYTRNYHPSTDGLMVFGSLYLALCFSLAIVILMEKTLHRWVIVLCAILAGIPFNPDAICFLYPLLVSLVVYRLTLHENHPKRLRISKYSHIYLALLFLPFGLLPLIKGSMAIPCLPVMALSTMLLVSSGKTRFAISVIMAPAIGLSCFWLLAGQHLATLPSYISTMWPLISGYTEAMAIDGNKLDIIYFAAAVVMLIYTASIENAKPKSKIYLLSILLLFLFLSFKAGFVRHDGHALLSSMFILLSTFAMPFALSSRRTLLATAVSLICFIAINHNYNYNPLSTKRIADNLTNTYRGAYGGILSRLTNPRRLDKNFINSIADLKKLAGIPFRPGTADVYPIDQSYLIASGYKWSPRPTLLSYASYTPDLAAINEQHLRSSRAPDTIFFNIGTIDGRLPPMDDGLSWPTLLLNYVPLKFEDGFLVLHKKEINNVQPKFAEISAAPHELGDAVVLPSSNQGALFVQVEIKKTILGKLVSILFKPSTLEIAISLNDGRTFKFRVNSKELQSGFILSPLILTARDFAFLYGGKKFIELNSVKAISIGLRNIDDRIWRHDYVLKVSAMEDMPYSNLSTILKFDAFTSLKDKHVDIPSGHCEGFVDTMNGGPPSDIRKSAGPILSARGWIAESVKNETVPKRVFITLSNTKGATYLISTHKTPREDVRAFFKSPHLPEVGFEMMADITSITAGSYTFGVAYLRDGQLKSCPQFGYPVAIPTF